MNALLALPVADLPALRRLERRFEAMRDDAHFPHGGATVALDMLRVAMYEAEATTLRVVRARARRAA